VEYYLELVKTFFTNVDVASIEIQATSEERDSARKLLRAEGIPGDKSFLALNPGAAYGSAKRWHAERFADVADTLAREFQLQVALIGSGSERPISNQIRDRMKTSAAILTGKTSLETLIGVLAESSLMITNDSGPMHIAAALGIPTVAVFGSTDERVTGPYGPRARIVKYPVECSPCLLRDCPIDHRCMNGVTVDDVCNAARKLIKAV
jgi:heptosyltransferase II